MMAAEQLRDLSQPIDVSVLDATVAAFYGTGSKEERTAADQILWELQTNPDISLQVVHILQSSQNLNTKFFALQVLESVIKYRWNALPVEQRDGMKNYISEVIVQLSGNEASFRRERLYVNKLNIILVQILKHEWPARWRSFIPDLVSAAKTNEIICENCMAILKLLSEEVFDLSRGEMTQVKIKELKQSLNSEFQFIHELCLYVLSASQRTELVRATLATLHAFLSWIPLGYIFESPLLEKLLNFFPVASYRNLTLQCLTEVASLQFGDFYDAQYVKMFTIFMVQLQTILPTGTNIPEAYANGSSEEQAFIQNLALFFTSFFKSHIRVLESSPENRAALLLGLEYLIGISYVDDTEVFKVCLDYWNSLVLQLFDANINLDNPAATASAMGLQVPILAGMIDGLGSQILQRRQLYAEPMSKLRMLMICRMAKPEEVLIEDENGNIVREAMKDNDVLVQYKIMRETLIYLSHLDHDDTEQQMLKKLSKQLNGEDWSWNNLNALCWAIGSISGSMMEEQILEIIYLLKLNKGQMDSWVSCRSKMMKRGSNDSNDGGEKRLGVVRRMGSMGRKRVEPLCISSPLNTPMKKSFGAKMRSEKSILESLPEDVLVRVICGVDHEDLERLVQVSRTIRDATIIAKKWHFEYRTPSSKSTNLRPFSRAEDESNFNEELLPFTRAEDESSFNEELLNAPKQPKRYRSRLSQQSLADISIVLFHSSEEEMSE